MCNHRLEKELILNGVKRDFVYKDENYRELSGFEITLVLPLGHKAFKYHS